MQKVSTILDWILQLSFIPLPSSLVCPDRVSHSGRTNMATAVGIRSIFSFHTARVKLASRCSTAEIAACFLSCAQHSTLSTWKEGNKGSAPLIKELWPHLTVATLQICWWGCLFLQANTGFMNIFLVKCWPLIHLAAHSALYKTSERCRFVFSAEAGTQNDRAEPLLHQTVILVCLLMKQHFSQLFYKLASSVALELKSSSKVKMFTWFSLLLC